VRRVEVEAKVTNGKANFKATNEGCLENVTTENDSFLDSSAAYI
jgi:hypothetical protein